MVVMFYCITNDSSTKWLQTAAITCHDLWLQAVGQASARTDVFPEASSEFVWQYAAGHTG
jgi:hypothetical protein